MRRYKILFSLAFLVLSFSFVWASGVSVWQGQYYTGNTFNQGTYTFNFTVYDSLTGGNACFTNTTTLTTGYWGQWSTEQTPWSSCDNASKNYFLNINIDGVDQTPRRRLVVQDFLRRDVEVVKDGNLEISDNVTANYFFGDGRFLTGVNGSGDINSVQGDEIYLYNGSDSGDVVLAFNETKLNSTIDLRASGTGDNSSWNETYADTKYILQSNESNLNVNSSVYSNSTSWWSSLSSWLSGWFVNNGGQLEFNETKLNNTIDLRDNDTTYSHLSNFTDDVLWTSEFNSTGDSRWLDDTDTQKNASGYLFNDSTTIYLNESRLNETIDLRDNDTTYSHLSNFTDDILWTSEFNSTGDSRWLDDTDTQKNASGYLFNDSTTIYLNESRLNETIDLRDNETTYSHLSNFTDDLGDRGYTSNLNFSNDANYWNDSYASFNESYADTKYLNLSGTNADQDINISPYNFEASNLTLTKKITFALGEVVDNIVDSWVRVVGNLNATGDVVVGQNLNVTDNITTQEVHFQQDPVNHRIYDNSTCVIIRGDTSSMYIC